MKESLSYSTYQMAPAFRGGPNRQGALIAINNEGFADLHPLPAFGDPSIALQLESLRVGEALPLAARSLAIARIDREARLKGRSLFDSLIVPLSHAFLDVAATTAQQNVAVIEVIEKLREKGFEKIKIKINNSEFDLSQLKSLLENAQSCGLKLRIDCNRSMSAPQLREIVEALNEKQLEAIDYFEDPFDFSENLWPSFQDEFALRFALDEATLEQKTIKDQRLDQATPHFAVAIVKAAREDDLLIAESAALNMRRIVVGHSFDHPLGQSFAAFCAARLNDLHPLLLDECALLTPNKSTLLLDSSGELTDELTDELTEPWQFSHEGPRFVPAPGLGLGFDTALRGLNWKNL